VKETSLKNKFTFWIEDRWILGSMWETEVKPGTKLLLRGLPPPIPSVYSPPAPPPPPSSPPPGPSTFDQFSNPVRLLEHDLAILNAKGCYRLPFSGCEDRVFKFWDNSSDCFPQELGLYLTFRNRTPLEQWSNLAGNFSTTGNIVSLNRPTVSIGPAFAGHIKQLEKMRKERYVIVEKGKLSKVFRDKDESAHFDGDNMYRWMPYPSWERAKEGLIAALSSGFSIEATWIELNMSSERAAELCLIGKEVCNEEEMFFAVVDSSKEQE
jgi:hypothetical protein